MKLTSIILILSFITLSSCSSDNNKGEKLIWSTKMQFPDSDSHQSSNGEEIYCDDFIDKFEKYNWFERPIGTKNNASNSEPLMSIKDTKTNKVLWISIENNRNENTYLIGYSYIKKKKGFLGFPIKKKEIPWFEMYLTTDKNMVKNCIKHFFERNYEELENKIRKLEAKTII